MCKPVLFLLIIANIAFHFYPSPTVMAFTVTNNKKDDYIQDTARYRLSIPILKRPPSRVPQHLQDIHLVRPVSYNSDAIKIIDPPRHFQEQKKIIQQIKVPSVIRNKIRCVDEKQQPTTTSAKIYTQENLQDINIKLRNPFQGLNLLRPQYAHLITAGVSNAPNKDDSNILISENESSRFTRSHNPNPLSQQYPYEVLASVRKIEKRKVKPQPTNLRKRRQRIKTHKTQTVVIEKGNARSNYKKGENNRISGSQKSRRARRHVSSYNENRGQLAPLSFSVMTDTGEIISGIELLTHISSLLRNASNYSTDEINEENENEESQKSQKERYQPLSDEPDSSENNESSDNRGNNYVHERDLFRILENSLNATENVMADILKQNTYNDYDAETNVYINEYLHCIETKTPVNRFHALQLRIDCMKKKLFDENAPMKNHQENDNPQKNLSSRKPSQKPSSQKNKQPVLNNHQQQQELKYPTTLKKLPSAVYADVMANIRNLLKNKNKDTLLNLHSGHLYNEQSSHAGRGSRDSVPNSYDTNSSSGKQSLKQMKQEQQQENRGPQSTEIDSTTKASNWYLIKPDGKIYSTELGDDVTPTAAIFHRFPDIPNAQVYLTNEQQGQQNAYEF